MNPISSLGQRVRQQRQRCQLTQIDVAQLVGCTVSMIKKIEADLRHPSLPLLERLVDAITRTRDERDRFCQLLDEIAEQPVNLALSANTTMANSAERPKSANGLPEGIVTFLLADIGNSLALWEEEPQAMDDTVQRYQRFVRQIIEIHEGIVFRTIGDTIYSVFTTAAQAVHAAQQVQATMQEVQWNATGQVEGRIILHTGPARLWEGDYFGPTLCRAMRLLNSGKSNQTLVTQATQTLLQDPGVPAITLQALGCNPLPNSSGQQPLFRLVSPGPSPTPTMDNQGAFQLTRREKEVVHLVAEGLTSRQIAKQLYLSPHTVNAHLRAIFRKSGVSSRTALIRFALAHGFYPIST